MSRQCEPQPALSQRVLSEHVLCPLPTCCVENTGAVHELEFNTSTSSWTLLCVLVCSACRSRWHRLVH